MVSGHSPGNGIGLYFFDELGITHHQSLPLGLMEEKLALHQSIQRLLFEVEGTGEILRETLLIEPAIKSVRLV
jgi:hypothetical protein